MEDDSRRPPWAGIFHLSVLYTVWSSTYLAIRIAVRPGSGFPPFSMSGLRVLAAGLILLTWALIERKKLRVSREQALILTVSGLLLWVGGNGLVTWAEQRAESGFAALLVGSMPIWAALLEAIIDRELHWRLLFYMALGLTGVGVLTWPKLAGGDPADVLAILALLAAPALWAVGTVVQRRRPGDTSVRVSAAYQSLAGAAGFGVLVLITGEPTPAPTSDALAAWAYLVVFGSVLAFTSFVHAVRLLPMSVTTTYAYVNPVGAALLGWCLLDESITAYTVAGAVLILVGVAGVFREKYGRRRPPPTPGALVVR